MSKELLRELVSALSRLRREPIDPQRVDRWAERLEHHLAELELMASLTLPDELEPAARATPAGTAGRFPVGQAPAAGGAIRRLPAGASPLAAGAGLQESPAPAGGEAGRPAPAARKEGEPAPGRYPLTLAGAARRLRRRELSASQLLAACLDRIREAPELHAFIAVFEDGASREAEAADSAIAAGRAGLLAGVPVAVKDLMRIRGYAMTGGSRALDEGPAPADAEAVARLREAGAVIVGAANLHELAYGVTSENPHFGAVQNPRRPGHVAGGSSGGSAAAVAAGMALGAVGTDTGGSIRIPAAACGVVGLKPTLDAVSRRGVLPLSWSLDHVGPLTATCADAAVMLAVMADGTGPDLVAFARALVAPGPDPDAQAALAKELAAAVRVARAMDEGTAASMGDVALALGGMRVGYPPDDWLAPVARDVAGAYRDALERLARAGASVALIDPPPMAYVRAAQFMILQSEATAFHRERVRRRENDLGADVWLRLKVGEFLTAVEYVQAQRLRRQVADAFLRLLDRVDVLVLPTLPLTAPPLGSRAVETEGQVEPVQRALTRYTSPFNQSGLPALSLPVATGSELTVSVQVVGRPFAELDVLRVGIALEALMRA